MRFVKDLNRTRGRANWNAQLTEAEVLVIRQKWDAREASAPMLARVYGVSGETIRRIGRRETWGWLEEGMAREEMLPEVPLPPATPETERAAAESAKRLMAMMERGEEAKSKIDWGTLTPKGGG